MLTEIHIKHLATVDQLSLSFQSGTTVITGETGSGKSILIDAIELALGKRATAEMIRAGHDKAEISICFDVRALADAKAWLKQYELDHEDDCIIRRTIDRDGRNRVFINGMPTTLQLLRELSECLIDIHSQHEHQLLLKPHQQRDLLDRFAAHSTLLQAVASLAKERATLKESIDQLQKTTTEKETRGEFLQFQLRELQALQLEPNEFQTIALEHKQLSHGEALLKNMNQAMTLLADNEELNAMQAIHQSIEMLDAIKDIDPKIPTWIDALNQAFILIQDTNNELRKYVDSTELDPERLQWLEQRMSTLFDIARKHKVMPEELLQLQNKFAEEWSALENNDEHLAALQEKLKTIEKNYLEAATALSASRKKYAEKLQKIITQLVRQLSLPHAHFQIQLEPEDASFSAHGLEKIIFLIQPNVGLPMQPIAKIASGGELSRISLAVHAATAKQHTVPTLVLDEVDVGIGGGTAEIVGKLLRSLGATHQVLCITHLPQVAAQGHHHCRVEKFHEDKQTFTRIAYLDGKEKIQELARMLGGVTISETVLRHAKEMLEQANY